MCICLKWVPCIFTFDITTENEKSCVSKNFERKQYEAEIAHPKPQNRTYKKICLAVIWMPGELPRSFRTRSLSLLMKMANRLSFETVTSTYQFQPSLERKKYKTVSREFPVKMEE